MNPSSNMTWSPQEAASINEFLSTPLGMKWLTVLINRKPKIDTDSTERAALSGAKSAGYELFWQEIASTRSFVRSEEAEVRTLDPTKD
jgi:hypothetical protein